MQRKSLRNMATEAAEWTVKGEAARKACARDYARFKSLQEEFAKAELTTNINTMSHQVREAKRDTREKERNAALGIQ
jgi:hypothetical protein